MSIQNRKVYKRKVEDDNAKTRSRKLRFIEIAMFGCFVFLIAMVYKIKNVHGQEYEFRAINQLIKGVSDSESIINPNRGNIVDRNMTNMAVSTIVYDVFIDVREMVKLDKEVIDSTVDKLNNNLKISKDTLYSHLEATYTYNSEGEKVDAKAKNDTKHLVIAKDVPAETVEALRKEKPSLVYYTEVSKRKYLNDSIAAHILGFTRGDSSSGLESKYDSYLTGVPGRSFRTYTSDGVVESQRIDARNGGTLITTVDLAIQQICEEVAAKTGEEYRAKNVTAIVMQPYTGEIIASAEYPSFNLNDPTSLEGINSTFLAQNMSSMSDEDYYNNLFQLWSSYNVTNTFEPGSIFKPITVAAALEEGVITTDETFYCSGKIGFTSQDVWCHVRSGHGAINLEESLKYSCNCAMMHIAEKLGKDTFYKYQTDFGYGERTGIDLPAESSASTLIHSPLTMGAIELATSSFGQRFKCTPMQAMTSFCALLNGGNLMKPYIVSRVQEANGEISLENNPTVVRKIISQETSDYIRDVLEQVVSPDGTGRRAIVNGYSIGGKTGTGEQGIKDTADYHYALSFIGYFPVEKPEYVLLTLINWPEEYVEGSSSAAPMFKEIVERIIDYKKIPPTYTSESEQYDAGADRNAVVVGNYIGKRLDTASKELNQLGLDYGIIGGSGTIVTGQFPEPGAKLVNNKTILLTISVGEGELTEVPDTAGMAVDFAISSFIEAELDYFIVDLSSDPDAEGNENTSQKYVVEQNVEPGVKVIKGTQIRITIATNE